VLTSVALLVGTTPIFVAHFGSAARGQPETLTVVARPVESASRASAGVPPNWNGLQYLVPRRVCDCEREPCASSIVTAPKVAVISVHAMAPIAATPTFDQDPAGQQQAGMQFRMLARTVARVAGSIPNELPIKLVPLHFRWVRPHDLAVVSFGSDGVLEDFMICIEDEPLLLAASVASWRGWAGAGGDGGS